MRLSRGWRRGIAAAAIAMVAFVLLGGVGSEASSGNGFTFSPALSQIDVPAAEHQVQFALTLRNQAASDQNFRLSVVDFGSLDEQGGVAFLGEATSELEHQYGLASWMKADRQTVVVPARDSAQLKLVIENRNSLAPGGHYGAVLATAIESDGRPAAEPRVGVKQVLSSLVLVTKEGGLSPKLTLVSQSSDGGWGRLPKEIEQRFHNSGNVHVVPRGVSEVRDATGRVVARGALNDASRAVLPDSFRRYKTPLVGMAKAWMPGQYRIVTSYRYDGSDVNQTLSTKFWYAGQIVVLGVVVLAMASVGFLGWWLWRRFRR